ncbi:hypothetical protein FJZ19_00570 [Candidatus Pacearchaeota archaeon]|nr:hypothetical protein [Candidatus Pacearchaeota archaeon]
MSEDEGLSIEAVLLSAGKRGKPIGRLVYSEIANAMEFGKKDLQRRVKVMVYCDEKGMYEVNYSFQGCGGLGIHEPLIGSKKEAIRIAKKLIRNLEIGVEYISGTFLKRAGRKIVICS